MHPYRAASQRVLHRWFVQYNPLYVLSAALVLVGLTLMNNGLASDPSRFAMLSPRVVTELYAFGLIGSAAVLMRFSLRRPAVFAALLAVIYQGDPTLGTETYALVAGGAIASVLWAGLFAVKIHLLGRALRLRVSRSAFAVPVAAAAAVAIVPHLQRRLPTPVLAALVALVVCGVMVAALVTERKVEAVGTETEWQGIVRRRSLRATWAIWGTLGAGHVAFWTAQYQLAPRTTLAWGVTTVFGGFFLLVLATVTSVRVETRQSSTA